MKQTLLTITTLILTCFISHAQANSVPPLINYQGMLTDANGTGLAGVKKLEFNLYDSATSGNKVWGPQIFSNVPLMNGMFNVILGTTDTEGRSVADAFGSGERYLGIRVGDGQEISPRQQILSAPFAIHAAKSEHAAQADRASQADIADTVKGLPPADYDSGWFDVAAGNTYKKEIGFADLPKLTTAYYKRSNGQVFAWGLNQFDNSYSGGGIGATGIALDFDENGLLYVRTPSGNRWDSILHLFSYRNRTNDGDENIYIDQNVQFRIWLWK